VSQTFTSWNQIAGWLSRIFVSWNQLDGWLRQVDGLRGAA
jgi:hypothetical protein